MKRGELKRVREAILSQRIPTLKPVHSEFLLTSYPQSTFSFWGNDMGESHTGDFFVRLSAALYGGDAYPSREFLESRGFNSSPDILRTRSQEVFESKSCSLKHTLILKPPQLLTYLSDQLSHPGWNFSYGIFRHRVRQIRSIEQGPLSRVNELRNSIDYGMILPLGLIDALNSTIGHICLGEPMGSICTSTGMQRVYSSTLNSLFSRPEACIESLGLRPTDYRCTYARSPLDFACEQGYISQFPILTIDFLNRSTRSSWEGSLPIIIKEKTRRREEASASLVDSKGHPLPV